MRSFRVSRYLLVLLVTALSLSGCARRQMAAYAPPAYGTGGPYVAAAPAYAAQGPVQGLAFQQPYMLDTGDRVRISVFGQEGVSNSYIVDAAGQVNIALIGPVAARGLTPPSLSQSIAARLRDGFVREPHVSVEVEAYRPFYILGEVNAPGQYPYQPGMSVETAIAIAGGYSPRADKRNAMLTRAINGAPIKNKVPLQTQLRPGDTVNVPERWF
jgi:polysaccharide export outer membrane protein